MVDVVSTPGSNLIFHNTYATTLPAGYLAAIVTAEHDLQAHFTSTNTVTINVTFDLKSISNTFSAYNNFQETTVS